MNLVLLAILAGQAAQPVDAAAPTPEERALAFLTREVPRWSVENKCYSCHNNGDAARALYQAARRGHKLPDRALADTSLWLAKPASWDRNGGDGPTSDKGLARIQFAAALVDAVDAGAIADKQALAGAAELVAANQKTDGSWRPDGEAAIGSPATYGPALTTCQARRVLLRADPQRYREAISRADLWLRQEQVKSVLDAAAVLLALEGSDDTAARAQRQRCLEIVRKGQSNEGGWGPYATSPPEVFDSALVIFALTGVLADDEIKTMIKRGRSYLISMQQPDGSWRETTRPSGAESYAQRISTSGWATLALLATEK